MTEGPKYMDSTSANVGRRQFLRAATFAGVASFGLGASVAAETPTRRRFRLCLACGPIGVRGDARKALGWASEFGFEAVEPSAQFLGALTDGQLSEYLGEMKAKNLAWGAAGLPL